MEIRCLTVENMKDGEDGIVPGVEGGLERAHC